MKTFLFRALPAAIVAMGWLGPAVQAATLVLDDASAGPSRTVFYADLNLRSEAGVARLHARISQAARAVCGGYTRSTLAEAQWRSECREKAIDDAVASADHPFLTRYHAKGTLVAWR